MAAPFICIPLYEAVGRSLVASARSRFVVALVAGRVFESWFVFEWALPFAEQRV